MAGDGSRAELGDEERHQGEGRNFDEMRKSHRQAELQQFTEGFAARPLPGGKHRPGPQRAAEAQVSGGTDHREGADDDVRHAAAEDPERVAAPLAGDQEVSQHAVQQGAAKADQQQRTRAAEGVAEGMEGPVEQYRRHPQREQCEVGARLLLDQRVDGRQGEQRARVTQEAGARHRQQQRQPQCLLQGAGDFLVAARTVQVCDGGCDGLDDARQRKDDRDVDATADGNRRQIVGSVVAKQHGVDDHHSHRRQLGKEYRRRVRENLAELLGKHVRRDGGRP